MARPERENANPILWVLFLTVLYVSNFFVPLPDTAPVSQSPLSPLLPPVFTLPARGFISAILAGGFLILTAVSLHVFNNRFSSGLNFILPLLYLILALANPCAIWFTQFHLAALGLVWALRYFVKYKAETGHPTDLFCAFFLLLFSSCFYLPSIWLAPFMLISGFGYMENKLRYFLALFFGLLSGAAFIAGLNYLLSGNDALAALPHEWAGGMSAVATHRQELSLLQLCREGLLVILVFAAALRNLRNQGKYRISESRMLSDVTLCTIVLLAVTILYLPDYSLPFEVMVFAPASLVIFGLFGDSRKSLVTVFGLIIMVLILIERALGFLEIENIPQLGSIFFFAK